MEGVTKDSSGNTLVLPYYIGSKYFSGVASDNKRRSQPGLAPASDSHNSIITNYQAKGAGYWGAGAEVMTFHILMNYIKYGTKNSQAYNAGCLNYNCQYPATVTEADVERIIISKT